MTSECDDIFLRINKKAELLFLRIPEEYEKSFDWLDIYCEELHEKIKQAQDEKCNNVPFLPRTPARHKRIKRPAHSTSSDDEHRTANLDNKSTDITDSSINTTGKPKRNASKLAEQNILVQSQLSLKTKLRRPGKDKTALNDISNNSTFLNIKAEKKSASPFKEPVPQINLQTEPENIKKENMPPPAAKPKKSRKKIKKEVDSSDTENESIRVTRSKRGTKTTATKSAASKTKASLKNRKDSDVILQEMPVPVVVIESDTEDAAASQLNSEAEQTTESSKQVLESIVGSEDDDVPLKSRVVKKKTKRQPKKAEKVKEPEPKDDSVYEDALPIVNKDNKTSNDTENTHLKSCTVVLEKLNITQVLQKDTLNSTRIIEKPNLNETHVLSKPNEPSTKSPATMNCTVVLDKLNETVTKGNSVIDKTVILSPKEHEWKKANIPLPVNNLLTDDDSIVDETPEKKPQPPRKGIKTKQMFSPYSNSPVRKRVAAFEKLVEKDTDVPGRVTRVKTRNMEKENTESSAKSRYFTPTTQNKLPSGIPLSETKTYRHGTAAAKNTSSFIAPKSASAMKPSRAELQLRREEEQKKRLEKEDEAKRKREAMMQAKADEQRKKREEKQMKAQKAREEMEREKEERIKQMIQEKEEEQQKKREWQVKKAAEIEERKRVEAEQLKLKKLREQEKARLMEEKRKRQLLVKPPPLPLGLDYDEDSGSDSDQPTRTYQKLDWAQSHYLYRTLMLQKCVPKAKIEELFQMAAQTPDLREIFETVDERILRRNSSAVWRTPPRYSTLPKF